MAYSIPYILLYVFLGICAFLYENAEENEVRKQRITIISALAFFLFFGFRGYVYTDWIGYTDTFRNVEWGDLLKFDITDDDLREPGFTFLCLLIKTLTGEYVFLNLTCTVIYLVLLLRFCRQFDIKNTSLVLMLFIAMDGAVIALNLMRNSISIAIWLNALIYIKDRKPLPYFGLCLLALSFHLSAILFFPLYFALNVRLNRWTFGGAFLFFFLFFLTKQSVILNIVQIFELEGVLGVKAEAYTELYVTNRGLNPSGTLEKFALATFVFIYYQELSERFNGGGHIILNTLLFYFFAYYFCGEFKTMSDRLSTLFVFARWVVWIEIINILIIENNRKLLAGSIFLFCLYMTALNYNDPILEYDNVLTGAKSEAERRQVFYKIVPPDE